MLRINGEYQNLTKNLQRRAPDLLCEVLRQEIYICPDESRPRRPVNASLRGKNLLPYLIRTVKYCKLTDLQCHKIKKNPQSLGLRRILIYFTFVIKAVSDFVTNHNTNAAVIQRLREMLAVEKRLQNASREN